LAASDVTEDVELAEDDDDDDGDEGGDMVAEL